MNREDEGGCLWSMNLMYWNKDRTMEPVEIVLERQNGIKNNGGIL
jgi:hypothetical protein